MNEIYWVSILEPDDADPSVEVRCQALAVNSTYYKMSNAPDWVAKGVAILKLVDDSNIVPRVGQRISSTLYILYCTPLIDLLSQGSDPR